MVYRIYVEKKTGLANEAQALKEELNSFLGIRGLTGLRLLNRYDVENIEKSLFDSATTRVFSEPQLDNVTTELHTDGAKVFAVEYLPGQFDQRADSAAQCVQILSRGERPTVRTARVYLLYGNLSEEDVRRIEAYVVNPVESRLASLDKPETLRADYPVRDKVETLNGFCKLNARELADFVSQYGLAMDTDDIAFCQAYFQSEKRDPTITEIRMIDTYWSDHCRHTTFLTTIDKVSFADKLLQDAFDDYLATRAALGRTKPVNLMDVATLAVRWLKAEGKLNKLDESEEINACTVKIDVTIDDKTEPWLLLFKNETHNHPTEIEPFGGAATCIGGAIRDPLSGRAYVYAAMRVTGAADPLVPLDQGIRGKLPQKKIVTTAAAGYSSYGNQIGLATGMVDEIYHPGYAAKRMEIGAVIGATKAANVRRECPSPGDVIILLGGRTGRDGCGGATGSSKSHTQKSLETCGAEVQKGNAPEERKLQRLFRNPVASLMIKRCNDFGAGGVSVAIGELADGVSIDLNKVPKKYEGLDGTELAISESQERMAVVVSPSDADAFIALASAENLEATPVAFVTESPRLTMRWNGNVIVDISREFLNSNGAEKHIAVTVDAMCPFAQDTAGAFSEKMRALAGDLNVCSKRGLSERFDSTIGAGTVLMPFGGANQLTPIQAMVHKISVEHGHTDDCSYMAWGYNPRISEKSPYHGAYLAVVESVSKLIATGASFHEVYLTFQEYFGKPGHDGKRWGAPLAALLGAFEAQKALGIGAIGGKDSMSGTFEKLDVPPTLVSFAVTAGKTDEVVSNEFKRAGHDVVLLKPDYDANGLPVTASLVKLYDTVHRLLSSGKAVACWTPAYGGVAEGILKMCFGNSIGFDFTDGLTNDDLFGDCYGGFILEMDCDEPIGRLLGHTVGSAAIRFGKESITLDELLSVYEGKLEPVFRCNIPSPNAEIVKPDYSASAWVSPAVHTASPKVLIPVFPGTNCEYDTAKALDTAGARSEIIVINNITSRGISESVKVFAEALKTAQAVFIPGGFSGGDEPDGSGKFITAFFRNEAIREQVTALLDDRKGLMCGVCNGFQALIKLGLVPYGRIIDTDATCPTLTFNTIGRHQSRLVRTRIASNKSPWLSKTMPGEIYTVPVSHGEGRFYASDTLIADLIANGQVATQYVDAGGEPTDDIHFNPNGSACAIEGITSPDGRVFGKMGHSERIGHGLYRNVDGVYTMGMFEALVDYYK